MAENQATDYIVPVVSEEVHADAVPVEKGGVRVTKRVESHDEILQQELRRGRAEIRRVKTERVVNGPQPSRQEGDTLIIPVVSEVLVVTKQWVVTEEIYVTRTQETERVEHTIAVQEEVATVERLDETGSVVASGEQVAQQEISSSARPVLRPPAEGIGNRSIAAPRRILSQTESIIKPKY